VSSLVIFDLDGTLSHTNVSFAFSSFLYKNKILSLSKMLALVGIYAAHKCGICSIEFVHNFAFKSILKGKSVADIQLQIDRFLQLSLPTLFRPYMLECLDKAKRDNAQIWLLSSSPECVVEPIAAYLGIHTTLATGYVLQDGKYIALAHIVTGKTKRACLDSFLMHSPVKSLAYSDSIHDLLLLERVDTPIAICPDRALRKVAITRDWQIWD
jgi:HAD superfamily hydrolase (TIGR01490 family)